VLDSGSIRWCSGAAQPNVVDWGPLLSRLHRRAEALDEACLRAWGHPHDHAIRQELLNALELDGSLQPEHARPVIRDRFKQVRDHAIDLSNRIRASADNPDGVAHLISQGIPSLRRSLAALVQVLAARHGEPRTN
jgi:hypothetical protein